MLLEILVEELSAEAVLRIVVPRIIGDAGLTVDRNLFINYHRFSGKQALLRKLPERLKGYSKYPDELDVRVLVLVDRDDHDCLDLKTNMEGIAISADLTTRTSTGGNRFSVCNRIVVEELEAWYIGDPKAVVEAYPRVPMTFAQRAVFRNPDAIAGGTWEALERLLQSHGYHTGGLAKVALADAVAPYMDPVRNRSPSFRAFASGLSGLVSQ
jgi:hypothetical protein